MKPRDIVRRCMRVTCHDGRSIRVFRYEIGLILQLQLSFEEMKAAKFDMEEEMNDNAADQIVEVMRKIVHGVDPWLEEGKP